VKKSEPLNILLVEDNEADVFLLKEALSAHALCKFTVIGHGDEVSDYFKHNGPAVGMPGPDLVVLDLNLPGKDGMEVLSLIRSNSELRDLVVAVVSSSPKDVMKKKTAQADCYVTKPVYLNEFLAIGKELLACIEASAA